MSTEILFPDYDKIVMHCKTLMSLNYPKYKNSWTDTPYEFQMYSLQLYNDFWKKRLQGEVLEFKKATNIHDAQNELVDIINICCMIYEQLRWTPDPYWRYGE